MPDRDAIDSLVDERLMTDQADPCQRPARRRRVHGVVAGLLLIVIAGTGLALVLVGFGAAAGERDTDVGGFEPVENYAVYLTRMRTWAPIDQETLADVPGVEPANVRLPNQTVLSADGSTLVLIDGPQVNWSRQTNIDPERITFIVRNGLYGPERASFHPPNEVVFPHLSADGSRLLLERRYYVGADEPRTWYLVDTQDGALLQSVTVPVGQASFVQRLTDADLTRIYIVVYPRADEGSAGHGPPRIGAYDLLTGAEIGWLTFDDIPAGMRWTDRLDANGERILEDLRPGVSISSDGKRLVIAHATTDELTFVDTETFTVTGTLDLADEAGIVERVMAWLSLTPRPAAAKAVEWDSRHGTFSADGRLLYLTGSSAKATDDGYEVHYSGVEVVDLEAGKIIARAFEGQSPWIHPAPDGRTLYVQLYDTPGSLHAILRLDAGTLEERARRDLPRAFGLVIAEEHWE